MDNVYLLVVIPCVAAAIIPLLDTIDDRLKRFFIPLAAFADLYLGISIFVQNYSAIKNGDFIAIFKTGWGAPFFTINFTLDSLGLLFSIIVSLALFLIFVYAVAVQENQPEEETQFFALLFIVLGMMQGIILTGDILNLFLFFEIMTVLSTPLIAIKSGQLATDAALKYLIYGLIGGIFFLLGIIFIWVSLNTLNIAEIARGFPGIDLNIQISIIVFLLLGLIIKLGIFPFHFWIPLAHSACPSSISALLSGVILEIYLYIFVRTFWCMMDFSILEKTGLASAVIFLGLFSSLVGHFFALQADDIKRMLAFSSVGNIGMIMAVVSLDTRMGFYGGILHIIAHLLMKSGLFAGTGYLLKYTASHSIHDFRGIAYKQKGVFISCIIVMLSMMGLPPLIGFMSKWYVLLAFIEKNGYTGITGVVVVILGSLISVIYYFRYIFSAYELTEQTDSNRDFKPFKFYWKKVVLASVYVFAALTVVSGIFTGLLDFSMTAAIRVLMDSNHYLNLILGG